MRYKFVCECIACANNYPEFDYRVSFSDKLAFETTLNVHLVEGGEKMFGLSLKQMGEMLTDCANKLRAIDNTNRLEFDNRHDVLMLQKLLQMLLMVPDADRFTIRDFESYLRNNQIFYP